MPFTPRLAVVAVIVILAAVNVVDVRVPHAALVAGPACAALLLWLARLAASNEAVGGAVGTGRSAQEVTVLGTVLFTAAAGVVFCELRRRSGSLLAPAGLHWAVNGLSVLAAAAVWAWASR
jgi:membrane protease YdiL (CAAX protease family)